ncbi:MAG: RidA family protein, partial [Proteobacteria bacterium]|nr:RidA family protein [Pseudomonadota bacterium]
MSRSTIHTENAPAAIGTYSQAVKVRSTVYLSGQIPLDPITMEMQNENFATETHQVFKNLSSVAVAAGGSLRDLVKLNIFMVDLSNF